MAKLLVIPTFDTVILPDVEYQLGVQHFSEEEKSRIKIDDNRAILVPLREDKDKEEMTAESFYEYGVAVELVNMTEFPAGVRIHVKAREKVRISDITIVNKMAEAEAEPVEEVMDITHDGEMEMLKRMKETSTEIAGHLQGGEMALGFIRSCDSVTEFAAMFCQFFGMSPEEKYALLETGSMKERCGMVQEALMRFHGTIEMQIAMNKRYDDSEGNAYKKAAIQKQIGILQDELNDLDPEMESEENEYKVKIEASGMPEECRKEADKILKRYMSAQPNDPEKNMMENWLDFVTALKWKLGEPKKLDLKRARRILDRDHYGLDKVKERIIQQLAVMKLKNEQSGSILLFVGAPGTGKTSLGKSIAEALGREYVRISLGGVRDEAEIRGHRRTYIGAMPGRIMEGIKRAGSMNPVVVLDEVDKLSMGYNGDPSSALLEVLDPEQNNTFTDHYMNMPYDLSNVFFICTANTMDTIPQPLLDRMEVIQLNGYTPVEKFHIGKGHLMPRALTDAGLQKSQLRITDNAIRKMIEDYTMEAGVRGLKKQFDVLCRNAAAKIVAGETETVSVKERNLSDFLGRKKILHDKKMKTSQAGVATGLAWTQAGGEILFIETAVMPGSGKIIITGQLGDVMKESATISVSLLKTLFVSDALDFSNKDIHIHVPQGAVPKDGPSAGVTLFTALTSLLTGITVSPELAMTGEISLRGQVLPIGGLPEKLMAAQRSGITTVLIPKDNEKDLEDVPEETRNELKIIPVKTVEEVIKNALHISLPESSTTLFAPGYAEYKAKRQG